MRSLFHAVEEISTRIAMDHLRRGLKLKVSFLLLTWQVWQGGYWLIDFQKIAQVLSWQQWGSNSVLLPVSQPVSCSPHLRSGAYSVGGSCFVNSFLSRCRQLYALQSTASLLKIRLPSSKQCGSWHGLWLLGEVSTGLCPCEMSEQGRLGKRLAFPCVLWQSLLPSFAKIPELVASCFARQCKLPKQQSLLHEMNLSMRCGAWRPSCMQAPADPNPYSISISHLSVSAKQLHLEQRHSPPHLGALQCQHYHPHPQWLPRPPLHWGDLGHQNLIWRSIKHWVGMVDHASQPNWKSPISWSPTLRNAWLIQEQCPGMPCTWARKRGLLGRLAIELQSDDETS